VNPGQRVKEPEYVQKPQHYGNDHNAVENGLDGSLHGDKPIHQPQQDADYDENFQELN
jgi:hypothetical protein